MDGLHDLDTGDVEPGSIYGKHTFFQQQFDWLHAWTNLGRSSYHSLQIVARKTVGRNFSADLNYTLAKAMDNGSAIENSDRGVGQFLNAFNPQETWSISDNDVRHAFNSNLIMTIPSGGSPQSKGLLSILHGMLSNWRLSSVIRWRTGLPFSPANGFNFPTNYFMAGPATLKSQTAPPKIQITKDATGGANIFAEPAAAYDSFEFTGPGFSGSRNVFHGPNYFNIDTGLQKAFRLSEGHRIQVRWATFNLFNTVNFDGRPNALGNRGINADLDIIEGFGRLRSLAGSPRFMQFGVRYEF